MAKIDIGKQPTTIKICIERTFNLGNYNSQKVGIEVMGELDEISKYEEIENTIKEVSKKIYNTILNIKDEIV